MIKAVAVEGTERENRRINKICLVIHWILHTCGFMRLYCIAGPTAHTGFTLISALAAARSGIFQYFIIRIITFTAVDTFKSCYKQSNFKVRHRVEIFISGCINGYFSFISCRNGTSGIICFCIIV